MSERIKVSPSAGIEQAAIGRLYQAMNRAGATNQGDN